MSVMELGHLLTRSGLISRSHSGITVSSGMEEMSSLNMPVQGLKVATLPLDLPLLWARNPFRVNFNHWQVSRKEAG